MKNDVAALRNIENRNLYEEIEQHLNAYEAVADAGIASMSAFIDAQNGDIDSCLSNINTTEIKLNEAETYEVESFETNGTKMNVVKVCEKRIKPLLKDSVDQIKSTLMENVFPESKPAVIGTMSGLTDKTVEINKGNYEVNTISGVMNANETAGIALPKAMKVANISVTADNLDDLEIQYSINGINWISAESTIEDGTMIAAINTTATYARVVNKNNNSIDVTIDKIVVSPVYNTGTRVVETDLGTYQNYVISNALDGRISTKFYSSAGATVGSYIRVDLGKEIPLYDVAIYYAGNPKGTSYGIDGFAATKLEISTDGVTWTQIGDVIKDENYQSKTVSGQLVSEAAYNAEGQMARYIKFSATESSDNWVQVFEIPYNETVDVLGDDTIDVVDTTITSGNVANLYDRDLTTAFAPDSVTDGDTLTYAMTSITNVGSLIIMQDPEAISNATVSVKDVDGNWSDIGNLDSGTNTFDVNKTILEVKLTFHAGNPVPTIYEIIAREKETVESDKTALQIAVDTANSLKAQGALDNVVPAVVTEFESALEKAENVLVDQSADQTAVDTAFYRLANAIHMLDFVKGDKSALEALLEKANGYEEENYTTDSWTALQEAIEAATEVMNDENALESDVKEALNNLTDAIGNLVLRADKTRLQAKYDELTGLDSSLYTEASWPQLEGALESAKAVLDDPDATQEAVDNAYEALIRAQLSLRLIPNKDLLQDLINKAETLNAANYSAKSWNVMQNALEEAKATLGNENATQEEIETAIKGLEAGIDNLVVKDAATTPVASGDTTASIKTGDSASMISALGLMTSLGMIVYLKKKESYK